MKADNIPERTTGLHALLRKIKIPSRIIILTLGFLSLIWFLIRVIPKPSRASYPCMKATAPWASAFVIYVIGLTAGVYSFKRFKSYFRSNRYPLAGLFLLLTLSFSVLSLTHSDFKAKSIGPGSTEAVNDPMGTGQGIYPGRVVWVYDPDATNGTCTNNYSDGYFTDANTNQTEVDSMLAKAVTNLTGETTVADAWDAIFHFYNNSHGKGDVGYVAGEIVFLKINATSTWWSNINQTTLQRANNSSYAISETSPQLVTAVLRHLVNVVGVPQANIYIGDPMKHIYQDNYTKWHTEFANVHYLDIDHSDLGRELAVAGSAQIHYSDSSHVMTGAGTDNLYQIFSDMDYMINIPTLKGHKHAGVTMFAKNHFGSQTRYDASHLHNGLVDPSGTGEVSTLRNTYGQYRVQVDLMSHEILGKKNLIYLMDALFTSDMEVDQPDKWYMTPFNNDWTSSIFISQDPVAIESVGFDFLYNEFDGSHGYASHPHLGAVDDYLHQAADSSNWPDGVLYDPDGDLSMDSTLGVHEHWNNATDKKYSQNLGTGEGIELVKVFMIDITQFTTTNSDLLSNKVNAIYVDSFNVKWFGTDQGISRYDDTDWSDITTSTTTKLLNDNIKKLAYEKSGYGHELWAATNNGLFVMAFDVDGMTSATTYTTSNSDILDNNISAVGVDQLHNRWIGTPDGISIFSGSDWFDTTSFMDENTGWHSFAGMTITSIGCLDADNKTLITTQDAGVLRFSFDDVDGFTGASAYGEIWSGIETNHVNTVTIRNKTQWFGTENGLVRHDSVHTKAFWYPYSEALNTVLGNTHVNTIEIDDDDNVWVGTNDGLAVITSTSWYKYSTAQGLINPVVNDIKKAFDGSIWVATDGGVEKITDIPGIPVVISGVKTQPQDALSLSANIYPVPFDDYLQIDLKHFDKFCVASVYSIDGKLCAQSRLESEKNTISTSQLKRGIYILNINDGTANYSFKIVK